MNMMGKYRVILFDIDNTLWDETPIIKMREQIFRNANVNDALLNQWTSELISEKGFYSWQDIFKKIGEDYLALLKENKDKIKPFPDTISALEKINETYKIGYVTDGNRRDTDYKLECLGIKEFAEVVITTQESKSMKPSPKSIQMALQYMDTSNDNALYVGDRLSDVETAKNAKVDSALVYRKSQRPKINANPTILVKDLLELADKLSL